MLPDSGQSKWTAILAGDQGSVCLHAAQLERGRGAGGLSHTVSFFQMKLLSLSIKCTTQTQILYMS